METQQGSNPLAESAALQGSPVVESAGGVPPELQPFVATPSAAPSDALQGGTQGGTEQTGTTQPSERERQLQSLADQRLAESLRYQQESQRLQQELLARQAPQQQQNPYDPQNDYAHWWAFEKDDMARRSAQLSQENFLNTLQGMARQNAEYQWQVNHPGEDINVIKAFARSQGIAEWNLDAAHKLMNIPNQMAVVAQNTAQNAFTQFRQPQPGAVPLRGGTQTAGEVGFSYDKLASEYQRTNGEVAKTWPPDLLTAFRQETYRREVASRSR